MKKQLTRILSLMLCLVTAAASVACGTPAKDEDTPKDEGGTELSTVEDTTEKPFLDNLEEGLDFGGYVVRILTSDEESFETFEDTSDIVNAAVYNRNIKIEDRLNVKIETIIDGEWGTIATPFKSSVSAGSDDYDVYAGYCYWSIDLATSGYVINLANEQHLDLEREYWGKKFIDAMSYKNYIYWLTGDIALSYTNGMYATFVNLAKWQDNWGDESVYNIVRDGKWTLDEMTARAEAVYNDLNGNGKVDADDMLGYDYTTEDNIDGMAMAAGVKFTEFDAQGVPQLAITADPTKAVTFAEKLSKLCAGAGSFMSASDGGFSPFIQFANNNTLFIVGRLKNSVDYLREMTDDFAIIPAPKLDEQQKTYLTTLHDGTTIIGLPKTIKDDAKAATLATLEALAAESYKDLTPTYLDVALKSKYSRDAESAEMIDLIRENVISDFGFQYTSTGFNNFFRGQTATGGESVASTIAKREKAWAKLLEKIIQSLEDNAN